MTKSQIFSRHYFANIHLKNLGWDPSIYFLISIMKLFITRVFNCYGILATSFVKFGVGLVVAQPFIQN